MRKLIIILFLIVFNSLFVLSQIKPTIEIGKPYPVIDAKTKRYIKNDENILTLKDNNVQLLSIETMSLTKMSLYSIPKNGVIENICEFDGKNLLFYSLWDKENETEQLFYKEIDIDHGKIESEGKLLFKVRGKLIGSLVSNGFFSYEVVDKFNFQFSYDSTKLMIQYRLKSSDEENIEVGFYVLGKGNNKVWNKEVKIPYSFDYAVDGNGNVFTIARSKDLNSAKLLDKNGEPNYLLDIIRIEAVTGTLSRNRLTQGDKLINHLWMYEGNADYMVCAGYTHKGKDNDNADGIIVYKISKDGSVASMQHYPIPLEILNQYVNERTKKKNEKKDKNDKAEFQDLDLRNIKIQEDGSIILIGEQNYILTHTVYTNNQMSVYYTYHYNDILITKIEKNGQLAWMRKLPKRQTGKSGMGGMSYTYMPGAACHYLLYLDNVKNMELSVNDFPEVHSDGAGGYLTAFRVNDSDGKVSKISILDTKKVNDKMAIYQFNVSRIIPVSLKTFIFEVYKKKKEDILIKVTF